MGKCKYTKKCKLYSNNSETCNYNDGDYGEEKASCFINNSKKLLMFLFVFSILMLPMASALLPSEKWEAKENSKYEKFIVKDWIGMGKEIFTADLNDYSEECIGGTQCEAKIDVTGKKTTVSKIDFYTWDIQGSPNRKRVPYKGTIDYTIDYDQKGKIIINAIKPSDVSIDWVVTLSNGKDSWTLDNWAWWNGQFSVGNFTTTLLTPTNASSDFWSNQTFSANITLTNSSYAISNSSLYIWNESAYNMYWNTTGLVAWYQFDSGDARDYLGVNNGTNQNGAYQTTQGKIGGASVFDGSNDYVTSTEVNVTSNGRNLTNCLWIKSKSNTLPSATQVIFVQGNSVSASLQSFAIFQQSNKIRVRTTNGTATTGSTLSTSTTSIPENTWTFICQVHNGTNQILYYNGIEEDNDLLGAGNIYQGTTLKMGINGDGASNDFNGSIDDVRIYNRSLSATEIANLYAIEKLQYNDTYSGTNQSATFTYNVTNLTDGKKFWNVFSYDSNMLFGAWQEDAFEMTIDTTAPSINIVYPTAIDYATNVSQLNYTVTEINPDSCWYSLDEGATNSSSETSGTNWTDLTSNQGTNIWTIYCNDTFGNEGSSAVTFTRDDINPALEIITPTTDDKNNRTQLINISSSDTNLASTWFNWNGTNITYTSEINVLFDEGINTLHAYNNDTYGNTNYTNVTFTVDTTAPVVTIQSPSNYTIYNESTIDLNFTLTDETLDVDSCWYSTEKKNVGSWYADVTNEMIADCNNTTIEISSFTYNYRIKVYSNDTVGNIGSSDYTYFDVINQTSETYEESVIETSTTNFYVNFDLSGGINVVNDTYFTYNGTNYYDYTCQRWITYYCAEPPCASVSGYYDTDCSNPGLVYQGFRLVKELTAPEVDTTTPFLFNWTINFTNEIDDYNHFTDSHNQTVMNINLSVGNCSAGLSQAMCLDLKDEGNFSALTFNTFNYNFNVTAGGGESKVFTGSLTGETNPCLCINSSVTNEYIVNYGEIQYSSTGYSNRRYYLFTDSVLSNATNNVTLYSLPSDDSTVFQITATTTGLQAYVNHYISLLRWYPSIDEYLIAEMAKTDDNGQTVVNVKTNDVDYRLGVYETDGTLIRLLNPIRMVCQTTPCIYSIITSEDHDLTSFLNVQTSLDFNETTQVYTLTFNDASQRTSGMNLRVYQQTALNKTLLCNETSSSYTGILTCDVSSYSGMFIAEAWRSASPENLITKRIDEIRDSLGTLANGGSLGLFLGFLMVTTFGLIGLVSPVLVVILAILALIPMVILGNLTFSIVMLIGAIGGVVLHMLRRSSGQ